MRAQLVVEYKLKVNVKLVLCSVRKDLLVSFRYLLKHHEMEQEFGDLHIFPKELKFLILTHLDGQSLGRLMQVNKSFYNLPSEVNFWKYFCLKEWKLSSASTHPRNIYIITLWRSSKNFLLFILWLQQLPLLLSQFTICIQFFQSVIKSFLRNCSFSVPFSF